MNMKQYKRKIRAEVLMFKRWQWMLKGKEINQLAVELDAVIREVTKEADAIGLTVSDEEILLFRDAPWKDNQ